MVTVTGNLNSILGSPVLQGSIIQFFLTNLQGTVPTTSGSVLMTQEATAQTDYSGAFSVQLVGNDVITPAGTLYLVQFPLTNQKYGVPNSFYYSITGSSFNLNLATPINP